MRHCCLAGAGMRYNSAFQYRHFLVTPPLRPAPLRTDGSNAFARHTIARRAPAIVWQVIERNSHFEPAIKVALEALAHDMETDAPITMFPPPAPDYDQWSEWFEPHAGATWQNAQWWFAEVFMYRRIIAAVRWWETGRDPFAPVKDVALASPALWDAVEDAARTALLRYSPAARLHDLIGRSLWANRMDMSHHAAEHGLTVNDDDLLQDDRADAVQVWENAPSSRHAHLIIDNTGAELAHDFILVDALLGKANHVTLHLKQHPTFVSDATATDALHLLHRLAQAEGRMTAEAGTRLRAAFDDGRLRFAPDPFWNSPLFAWDMPPRLTTVLNDATLIIIKGDANYRRFVGDALYAPGLPLSAAVDYLPAPVLALRSLKSDPVLGLSAEQIAALDAVDEHWRTNGKRGVVQFGAGTESRFG